MVVPEQERIESDHHGHLFQALVTERVGTRNDAATRGIGEAEPATPELGCEDAVVREERRAGLLRMTLDPSDAQSDQDVEDHNRASGWRSWRDRLSSIHPT